MNILNILYICIYRYVHTNLEQSYQRGKATKWQPMTQRVSCCCNAFLPKRVNCAPLTDTHTQVHEEEMPFHDQSHVHMQKPPSIFKHSHMKTILLHLKSVIWGWFNWNLLYRRQVSGKTFCRECLYVCVRRFIKPVCIQERKYLNWYSGRQLVIV